MARKRPEDPFDAAIPMLPGDRGGTPDACLVCGGKEFWLSRAAVPVRICNRCHPPAPGAAAAPPDAPRSLNEELEAQLRQEFFGDDEPDQGEFVVPTSIVDPHDLRSMIGDDDEIEPGQALLEEAAAVWASDPLREKLLAALRTDFQRRLQEGASAEDAAAACRQKWPTIRRMRPTDLF